MTELNPETNQTVPIATDTQVNQNVTQASQEKPQENKEEKPEDPNWRAYREKRKLEMEELKQAKKRASEKEAEAQALKAAMEAAFSKAAPSPQAYQQYYGMNEEAEETEDQKIEKKVNAIIAKKQEQYERDQAQREMQEYPKRLARDFPDIEQVTAQENLDYLAYYYPEVSTPLQKLPEGYDRWADIYRAVKKFVPNHSGAKKEAAQAISNQQKPKSMVTNQVTHSGEPSRQSWQEMEAKRAQNWERMQRTLKGI